MTYSVGIDLGTTFSAVAVARLGRVEIVSLGNDRAAIPSVVLVREDGSILTGEAASRRALAEPERVGREFKRRLGDPTPVLIGGAPYSAESLMARLLTAVLDDVRRRQGGEPDHIAVTHPANWGPYKTDLLRQALQMAGILNASMLTEPEAAAISYAHDQRLTTGQTVAVYDLGGGTFDTAVLRKTDDGFEILGAPVGIERLGGIDFDTAVMGHVVRALGAAFTDLDENDPKVVTAVARLRDECVSAREALSRDTDVSITVTLPNTTVEVRLTRTEYESMIRPRIGDTVAALRQALVSARLDPGDLHAVLLVGGTSRTPLVAQMLSADLGRPVVVDADPKHAIAIGAANFAAEATRPASAAPTAITPEPVQVASSVTLGPAAEAPGPPTTQAAAAIHTPPPVPAPVSAPAAPIEAVTTEAATRTSAAQPARSQSPTPKVFTPSADRGPAARGNVKLVAGIAVAAIAAGAVYFLTRDGGGGTATETTVTVAGVTVPAAPSASAAGAADTTVVPASVETPSDMVPIAGGPYTVGTDTPEIGVSSPSRQIELQPFLIDRFEVSNVQYNQFVVAFRDPGLKPTTWGNSSSFAPDTEQRPIIGVAYEYADAYCRSLGRRLPTEGEWEVAASYGPSSGAERRVYSSPGDTFASGAFGEEHDVGADPANVSGFGVFDLTGNAWEYVDAPYEAPVRSTDRTVRGGTNDFALRNFQRAQGDPVEFHMSRWAGFRCAASTTDRPRQPGEHQVVPVTAAPAEQPQSDDPNSVYDFRDPTYRKWPTSKEGDGSWGYHPLEHYHLDTRNGTEESPSQALAVKGYSSDLVKSDYEIKAQMFVDSVRTPDSESGDFCFGIGISLNGTSGFYFLLCPNRDDNVRVFYGDPNEPGSTLLDVDLKHREFDFRDTSEFKVVIQSPTDITFFFNGEEVAATTNTLVDLNTLDLTGKDLAMYLQSSRTERVHVHVDNFSITSTPKA